MSLEHMRLVAREGCSACDGSGEQPSEDWQAFEKWASRQGLTDPEADEDAAVERYFLEVCGYTSVPPMREPCDSCHGTGSVDVEVPVGALLELVNQLVQRPLIPAGELDGVVDHVKRSMTSAAVKSQGLADPLDAGSWLRVCQEAAETVRLDGELKRAQAAYDAKKAKLATAVEALQWYADEINYTMENTVQPNGDDDWDSLAQEDGGDKARGALSEIGEAESS